MKDIFLVIALIGLLAAGCKKHTTATTGPINLPDGDYAGTFRYDGFMYGPRTSHITLHLHNGAYSGTTDITNYPAICSATFTWDTSAITFLNICHWPAVGDVIPMSGTYGVSIKVDSFVLTSSSTYGQKIIALSIRQ